MRSHWLKCDPSCSITRRKNRTLPRIALLANCHCATECKSHGCMHVCDPPPVSVVRAYSSAACLTFNDDIFRNEKISPERTICQNSFHHQPNNYGWCHAHKKFGMWLVKVSHIHTLCCAACASHVRSMCADFALASLQLSSANAMRQNCVRPT